MPRLSMCHAVSGQGQLHALCCIVNIQGMIRASSAVVNTEWGQECGSCDAAHLQHVQLWVISATPRPASRTALLADLWLAAVSCSLGVW
jgi:hypothetical protein